MNDQVEIFVNGEALQISSRESLSELLERLEIQGEKVAIEHNRAIVPRSAYEATTLAAGDAVEIVQFVGGG